MVLLPPSHVLIHTGYGICFHTLARSILWRKIQHFLPAINKSATMNFLSPPRSRMEGGLVSVNYGDEATECLQIKVIRRVVGYISHRQIKFHLVNLHHSVGCFWFFKQPPWAHENALVNHKDGPFSALRTKHIGLCRTYIKRPHTLCISAYTHDLAGWRCVHLD